MLPYFYNMVMLPYLIKYGKPNCYHIVFNMVLYAYYSSIMLPYNYKYGDIWYHYHI